MWPSANPLLLRNLTCWILVLYNRRRSVNIFALALVVVMFTPVIAFLEDRIICL